MKCEIEIVKFDLDDVVTVSQGCGRKSQCDCFSTRPGQIADSNA